MIFPKAKKIAKELDWHKQNDGVFGLYKGYFFNVGDGNILSNPQYKYVVAFTGYLSDLQIITIKLRLQSNKEMLKFSNFEIGENIFTVNFIENITLTKLKTVYALFDFFVDIYKELEIPEQDNCHRCTSIKNNHYYVLNGQGTIICDACFEGINQSQIKAETKRQMFENGYLTGLLGASVFSLLGILLWVVFAVYLGVISSGMAMVIALLGIKGYEYFGGKLGALTKYILLFANIMSIIVGNILAITAQLMDQGYSIFQAIDLMRLDDEIKGLVFRNIIISFTLAMLVWIWLLFIMEDKRLSIKLAEKLNA
ncbi:MAG TPA: hypothetical protein PKD51_12705 [Saprospiraceae bacterium]|nr:hypothetical protein [Saprospiraceae bacterium]